MEKRYLMTHNIFSCREEHKGEDGKCWITTEEGEKECYLCPRGGEMNEKSKRD